MKERPILFNGAMVRAILDGSKTQTRRPVSGCILSRPSVDYCTVDGWIGWEDHNGDWHDERCPMGKPGDRLWVRETWAEIQVGTPGGIVQDRTMYRADNCDNTGRNWGCPPASWRPSIHMPRWASRIMLEVKGVRLQRLQDITEEDAIAEGFDSRQAFLVGWSGIYGTDNRLVWAVEFGRVEG